MRPRTLLLLIPLLFALPALAQADPPVIDPSPVVDLGPYLQSVGGIVALTMGIVFCAQRLMVKFAARLGAFAAVPTWVIAVVVAAVLAGLASATGRLPGNWIDIVTQAVIAAGTAGGFVTWLKEPLDSPARKADEKPSVSLPLSNKASWMGVLMIPLVLLAGGCSGLQALSPTQQWGLASASVRAAESSLGAAHDAGLIDDQDIVTIDPVMRQAYDSLRAMRAEAVKGNYVQTQWFLVQVQSLVAKLATMEKNAKELRNGNGSGGNPGDNKRTDGSGSGPGGSPGGQAGLHAGGSGSDRRLERPEREGLGGTGSGGEVAAGGKASVAVLPAKEIEFD